MSDPSASDLACDPAGDTRPARHASDDLPAVLAIDGGNSKTDVALIGADGALLAQVRGPGTDAHSRGIEPTMRMLSGLVAAAARQAGLTSRGGPPGGGHGAETTGSRTAGSGSAGADSAVRATSVPAFSVPASSVPASSVPASAAPDAAAPYSAAPVSARRGSPVAVHTSACLANADLPDEEAALGAAIAAQGWSVTSALVNDTFAVLRAGLDGPERWGVAVTCGAGINCVGVAPDGRTARFLALGEESGDWGGGWDLGIQSLWSAMRAEDGRGPRTMLREAVPAHFGLREVRDVAIGVYRGTIAWDQLLGLVPVLFELAGRGDQVAGDLVRRQADEICRMALVTIGRLGLTGEAVPVVLGGGLLTARDPLLTSCITAGLAAGAGGAAGAVPRIVDVPPVAGAALLGLDQLAAPASAEKRLRAAYAALPRPALTPARD